AAADSGAQQAPVAGAPMAISSVPTAGGEALAWQAPPSWTPKAASAMRKGSYAVPGDGGEADLSITAFPGDVGGELANVNRWRGQVGLSPLGPQELGAAVSRFEANGLAFTVVDLTAQGDPGAKAILGAIVPFGGSTWFFKLMGPGGPVRGSRAAFVDFLHTVKAP
ncbi:MAG TPA: hypothetical protein VN877_06730, partial [Opitutaceae bacterium]|nr:hypothetical protein [Opitutaceae bacterium]